MTAADRPKKMHLDFETRSTLDLPNVGVHRYATHHTTDVWLACWAIDDGPIQTWFPGDPVPEEMVAHIRGGGVVSAHNAAFEWNIIEYICAPRYGWPRVAPDQLDCTAARAAAMALPRALGQLAPALGLMVQKDDTGRRLMLQMCRPRKVADGEIQWWDVPEKIRRLEEYCRQDLVVEREADKLLAPMSEFERQVWLLDFRMNADGVFVDLALVKNAGLALEKSLLEYNTELERITGGKVQAVTNVLALKEWLAAKGLPMESLDKSAVRDALAKPGVDDSVRRVLEIRREAGKSSTAKLLAFAHRTSGDRRMRENLMYHGASTGRWAGKGVQLQNLPRPELGKKAVAGVIEVLLDARTTVAEKVSLIEMLYGPAPTVIADVLRGCIVAGPGRTLYVSDFANIEGRVLAWVAGQIDLVQLFAANGKVYESMAAAIFRVPVEQIHKESKERQLGKKAVLGCGYGMGWEKFIAACAADGIVIDEDLARRTIETYRDVNDQIVAFWYGCEDAAVRAVRMPGVVTSCNGIKFVSTGKWLRIRLPSGRCLWYAEPRVEPTKTPWGKTKDQVSFVAVDSFSKKWCRQRTYGGALVENIVQAIARDLLAAAMLRITERFGRFGMRVLLTVHDEVIADAPEDCPVTLAEFEACMGETPDWAAGCPVLAADGFIAARYRK